MSPTRLIRLTWTALLVVTSTALANPPSSGGFAAPPMPEQALMDLMKSGARGTLAVRAVQGTKGGPGVQGDEVEITLFHRNQPLRQVKAVLDEHGVVMVSDLPVAMGVRPLVRIKHAGVFYQDAGPVMDAQKRDAAMDVTVYETTDEMPAWRVVARHAVAARRTSGPGVEVGETLIVENPSDRTWLGGPPTPPAATTPVTPGNPHATDARRTTVTAILPAYATEVELGPGFHGWCCTEYVEGKLSIQMPLMPGRMTYQFGYLIPENDGRVDLQLVNAAAADHIAVLVPNDGSTVETVQLQGDGVDTRGVEPKRVFKADNISAGQAVGVVMTRVVAAVPPAAVEPATTNRYVLWGVGGAIGLLGLLMVARKLRSGGAVG